MDFHSKSLSVIRIATRKSPLAIWQAEYVKQRLEAIHPKLKVEISGMLTEGDRRLAAPLAAIGGKGLFVKELEQAILERRADIAVHSIKDMPAELSNNLVLAAVCKREDPRDVFVSNRYKTLEELPAGALIGTSSPRRISLLKATLPHIRIENLRGNVGTRLERMDKGHFDGIILAAAGLIRLGEMHRINQYLDPETWIPAIGQGAVGIECRADNHFVLECLAQLEDPVTRLCIKAERAMNAVLSGSCQLPIAAHAIATDEKIFLRGMVGDPATSNIIRTAQSGKITDAEQIGRLAAEELSRQGADKILRQFSNFNTSSDHR